MNGLFSNMTQDPAMIAVLAAIVIASVFFLLLAFAYSREAKKMAARGKKPDTWLFGDFYVKLYSAFFDDQDPDEVAVKLGVSVEEYYKPCRLTGDTPNVMKLIVHKLEAVFVLVIGLILGLTVNLILMIVCLFLALYLNSAETNALKNKSKRLRDEMADDVPRFMDLLKTEVSALPIEIAINALCEKMDCLLTRELSKALHEMELGSNSWIGALEQVAEKYNVDTLSSLVLDITTAYTKGVSVEHAIRRKSAEIRTTSILRYKEEASAMTSKILIPVIVFQFMPLMILILYPVIASIGGML